jgi:calnexin
MASTSVKTFAVLAALFAPPLSATTGRNNLYFVETFDDGNVFESGKWVKSNQEKYQDQPILIKPAMNSPPELLEDKGIELTKEMKFYAFGSKFPSPMVVKDQDLVVQYEFKSDSFQCGGAYVKLPQASMLSNFEELDNDTPYTIMFGPDRCGSTNKVHFILQHQNPLTSKWEEKHFVDAPSAKTDSDTHLYTLHLRKDNSFAIYIDKKLEKEGNLLTSMQPSVNPEKIIDDPTDSKPLDWVDDAKIIDPEATKPADWDESEPSTIPDAEAVKPAGWLEDIEAMIDDPEAEKPSDWDDEEVCCSFISFPPIVKLICF